MHTFADLIDHVVAYAGNDATRQTTHNVRRAALNAYLALPTMHEWSYLWSITRVNTVAAYNTGTIAYDHTGGTYERQLTLTDGTWPSWALEGFLTINDIPYEIESVKSSTVLTLTSSSNPGADIASGTAYSLSADSYVMVDGFIAADDALFNSSGLSMNYVHPRDWMTRRRVNSGPAEPRIFTFTGAKTLGRIALRLWPAPDAVYYIDFLYRRRPRKLVYDQVHDGTASTTSTAVTGSNTRFKAAHVGSVIRFGTAGESGPEFLPGGRDGNNPAVHEALITAYTSETSITIDTAPADDLSGVPYVISDPIDFEDDSMWVFLLREAEKQYRMVARMENNKEEVSEYERAFVRAREADDRYTGREAARRLRNTYRQLRDMPADFSTD